MTTVYPWLRAPALRLLLPFALGITIQREFPVPIYFLLILHFAAWLVTLYSFLAPLKFRFRLTPFIGIAFNILLFTLGSITFSLRDPGNEKNLFASKPSGNPLLVTLLETPVERTASFRAQARVEACIINGKAIPASGRLLLYFRKDSLSKIHTTGKRLLIIGKPELLPAAFNPGGFNYRNFALTNGLTHRLYLDSKAYVQLKGKKGTDARKIIHNWRDHIIAILRKYITGEKERGLAEALLIGYREDLDPELVQAYTNTGVVHVIAISGLHLGLIYVLLLFLTKPLARRGSSALRLILIVAGLWSFSLMAGAQPSVLRSTVMFSFIALGTAINRRTTIINSLSLSALLLLCYNPFWLWDAGFQLSYTAVLSIVLFNGPIHRMTKLHNKALDQVWKLLAVTISAQILTTPVSVYHFHQFPTLFILTNIAVVPLSTLLLAVEILLCVLSPFHVVAQVTGSLLSAGIEFMNNYISRLSTVSFATLKDLKIDTTQTWLLYLAVLSIYTARTGEGPALNFRQKRNWLLTAGLATLAFTSLRTHSFIAAQKQRLLIVYSLPKRSAIEIIIGRRARLFSDSTTVKKPSLVQSYLQPSHMNYRINESPIPLTPFTSIRANQFNILWLHTRNNNILVRCRKLDLVIFSSTSKIRLEQLQKQCTVARVVADGTVPKWKLNELRKDCNSLNIPFYPLLQNGAFIMNL